MNDVLRRIGPHPIVLSRETLHRARRVRQVRVLRRCYRELVAAAPPGAALVLPRIGVPSIETMACELSADVARVLREADDILEHRVDFLGSGPVELGPKIDWHVDFKSGYRWPASFYLDLEVTRLDDDSDAKVPWELSRGHQLLTLARAAAASGEERYACELEAQLRSWLEANPPGYGINWVNTMEVGLRAVNIVWALATLESRRPLEPDLRLEVTRSLQAHGRHIAANLEGTPSLRSNHFLGNILGLLVLGGALRGDRDAPEWLSFARRAFEREILRQVNADGVSFEASLAYHGLCLEMFLLGRHAAVAAGRPLSARFDSRVREMLGVSRALRHPDGRIPQFGDNDSGRVLPAGFDRPPTHDAQLWLGAAILGGAPPLPGRPHPEVAWTVGLDAWERLAALDSIPVAAPTAFRESGLYVLRSERLHVVVRCGPVGQNGNGGHAHNDQMSFELSQDEVPLVVDSGTYAYTFDPRARNAFRSAAAHNSVVVDRQEPIPIVPEQLFRLFGNAQLSVLDWQDGPEGARLAAAHAGYLRLSGGVVHQRTFELDRRSASLYVVDELAGGGVHDVVSSLHLAPGTRVTVIDEGVFELERGDSCCRIRFWGPAAVAVQNGWVSDSYGARNLAPVLVAHLLSALPLRLAYGFAPGGTDSPTRRRRAKALA